MAELTFSQSERRSFLAPALIAIAVMGGIFAAVTWLTPHHVAKLTIVRASVVPIETKFKSPSMVVGAEQVEDDLYILATLRVEDELKIPIFLKDFTGTLTGPDGAATTTSAVQKTEFEGLYTTFPALKPSPPRPCSAKPRSSPANPPKAWCCSTLPAPRRPGTNANPPSSPSTSTTKGRSQ